MKKTLSILALILLLPTVASATITVSNPWVEIHTNANDTKEFTISVSGFGTSQDVDINVEVDGHKITNALGEPTKIRTGFFFDSGSVNFKPAQGSIC